MSHTVWVILYDDQANELEIHLTAASSYKRQAGFFLILGLFRFFLADKKCSIFSPEVIDSKKRICVNFVLKDK